MESNRIKKIKSGLRMLGLFCIFVTVITQLACVAAIPIIIYAKSTKHHTATVQIDAKAKDVYDTALGLVEADPEIKLLKKDDEKLFVEVEKGKLHASIKATSVKEKQTQLIVTADAGEKEEDKELALRVVTRICDKLGVKYTVAKE